LAQDSHFQIRSMALVMESSVFAEFPGLKCRNTFLEFIADQLDNQDEQSRGVTWPVLARSSIPESGSDVTCKTTKSGESGETETTAESRKCHDNLIFEDAFSGNAESDKSRHIIESGDEDNSTLKVAKAFSVDACDPSACWWTQPMTTAYQPGESYGAYAPDYYPSDLMIENLKRLAGNQFEFSNYSAPFPAICQMTTYQPSEAYHMCQPRNPGSKKHKSGHCKPCVFFHDEGCKEGDSCGFCHLCPAGEVKRRKKQRRHMLQHFYGAGRMATRKVTQHSLNF